VKPIDVRTYLHCSPSHVRKITHEGFKILTRGPYVSELKSGAAKKKEEFKSGVLQ
jgi:hypothetical protein